MNIQYEDTTLPGSYGVVGSFPKSFGYGVEVSDLEESPTSADKPRILLMGLRRSGKSSIQKVWSFICPRTPSRSPQDLDGEFIVNKKRTKETVWLHVHLKEISPWVNTPE